MTTDATSLAQPVTDSPSTGNAIFAELLKRIAAGTYEAGERLPAERELARILGASRPTLREALRRLSEWNMVEAKRGSGVVVKHRRDWTLDALPAFMRFGNLKDKNPSLPVLISDLLQMRRGLFQSIAPILARRIPPGGTTRAREAVHEAWNSRHQPEVSADAELDILRSLAEAGNVWPWLWMLNSLSAVYVDLAKTLARAVEMPDDFVPSLTEFLDAIEANEPERATQILDSYAARTDDRMVSMLEAMT